MHKPESVQENENKIHWDFEIQKDHLIPTRPDLVLLNKKRTCNLVDFTIKTEHKEKI